MSLSPSPGRRVRVWVTYSETVSNLRVPEALLILPCVVILGTAKIRFLPPDA